MDIKQEPKRYDIKANLHSIMECEHPDGFYIRADDPAYLSLKRDAEALRKLEEMAISTETYSIHLFRNLDGKIALLYKGSSFAAPSLTEAIEQVKL